MSRPFSQTQFITLKNLQKGQINSYQKNTTILNDICVVRRTCLSPLKKPVLQVNKQLLFMKKTRWINC